MENGDEGSSTESEYYDISDDDEPKTACPTKTLNLGGNAHAGAGGNNPELTASRPFEHGDQGSEFTGMRTQWNNILTPDLAAAVARVTAHTTRNRAPPPQVAIPDVEMQFPHSSDFVSPFAALATRTAVAETMKNETKDPPPTLPRDQEREHDGGTQERDEEQDDFEILETKQEPVPVPARVVIDLSLDSDSDDDDDDDEVSCRKIPAVAPVARSCPPPRFPQYRECPETRSTAIATHAQSSPRHTASTETTAADAAPRRIVLLFPRPPDQDEESTVRSSEPLRQPEMPIQAARRAMPAASLPTPTATLPTSTATTPSTPATRPSAAAPAPRLELTLSCNRCRRLVPDHSAAPPEHARYDCKCCGRKYAQDELSFRGANRRCLFCKPLEPPPPATPQASGPPQPWTPLGAEATAAAHEASISPAAAVIDPSPRAATRPPPSQAGKRLVSPGSSIVSRPPSFPLLSSPHPVVTCVTCHQQLFSVRSLASVQRELDPWFCTCCQRLLCKNESPPDTGVPVRSGASIATATTTAKPYRILRCASCAIAACDLDSQLKARRPHLEPLAELRRFAHILQNLMANHVRQLRAARRECDVHLVQDAPVKREIDQRFRLWRRRMLQLRHQQRQTLRRDDVSLVQYRAMFNEQLALEKEEVDVRSRLVAFLAVALQSQRVKLPREVRGIAGVDDNAEHSSVEEARASPRRGTRQARGGTAAAVSLHAGGTKRDAGQSDGQDAQGKKKKKESRHVDVRYLQYQPDRKGSER